MAAPKTQEAKTAKLLEDLLEAVQDLFILQALEAGANTTLSDSQRRIPLKTDGEF